MENSEQEKNEAKVDLHAGKISYSEYRILATEEDIKKFSGKMKPFWWENIPIIGGLIYMIRMFINQMDIDRGTLKKQIFIYHIIFMFCFLMYIYTLLSLITPWYTYSIYKLGVNKTKIKLANNDI